MHCNVSVGNNALQCIMNCACACCGATHVAIEKLSSLSTIAVMTSLICIVIVVHMYTYHDNLLAVSEDLRAESLQYAVNAAGLAASRRTATLHQQQE